MVRRYTRQEITNLLKGYNDYLVMQPDIRVLGKEEAPVMSFDRWIQHMETLEVDICKSVKVKDWVKVKSKESDSWMLRQIAEVPKPGKPIWCYDHTTNLKVKYSIYQLRD